jgi:hypothetical protein
MLSRMPLPATLVAASSLLLAQPAPGATCRSVGIEPQRTWRFERTGPQWQVTPWSGAEEKDTARVTLPPAAEVRLTTSALSVRGKTSNGGIDVTLSGTPAKATLDIYVSYELEVNVDASLTPKIDDVNTNGPIGVRCEVSGA